MRVIRMHTHSKLRQGAKTAGKGVYKVSTDGKRRPLRPQASTRSFASSRLRLSGIVADIL